MQQYFYHRKPGKMEGSILSPLNQLKFTNPELFDLYTKKYEGREELMEQRIPQLDCLWNDVIHLAPIHPRYVYESLEKLGKKVKKHIWYRWPIEMLEDSNAVIYEGPSKISPSVNEKNFTLLDVKNYRELNELPEQTFEYYQFAIENEKPILMFVGCPHLLLLGELDIKNAAEIEVGSL